jgi:hypothetical protein
MEALKGKKLTKNSKSQDKYNKKSGISLLIVPLLALKRLIVLKRTHCTFLLHHIRLL